MHRCKDQPRAKIGFFSCTVQSTAGPPARWLSAALFCERIRSLRSRAYGEPAKNRNMLSSPL
eukprot:556682-Prorocentrum_minimum.AAC.1